MKRKSIQLLFSSILIVISNLALGQEITVKGTVYNDKNQALPFVNIGIKQQNLGTVSDKDGEFSLTLSQKHLKDSLTFSFVGFRQKTFKIEDIITKSKEKIYLTETPS